MKNKTTIYRWNTRNTGRRLLYSAIYMLILIGLTNACDGFVQVDPPSGQLGAAAVFQDKATANAAMAAVYAKMRSEGLFTGSPEGLSHLLGLYAGELEYFAQEPNHELFYANALQPGTQRLQGLWNDSYAQVYGANAVIAGVGASGQLAVADRETLKGQALFVRAMVHFYLANLFGSVPYIETTDYRLNAVAAKIPVEAVYEKAKQDLQEAAALLPEQYQDAARIRPNKLAARALLARVCLYAGQWDQAADEASAVLNSGLYALDPDLIDTFLTGSGSTIWALEPQQGITLEGITFLFASGPPPLSALSAAQMQAFEPGDLRREKWVFSVSDGTNTWYGPYKYKQDASGSATESSVVLRLAEMYLIRAEARVRQGELIGAKEDLDAVRAAAGLPGTTAQSQSGILDAIGQERRVEFFTEFGHRFFDLKRTGRLDAVLGPLKPGWNSTDALLPLPEKELLRNPGLRPQNPGY